MFGSSEVELVNKPWQRSQIFVDSRFSPGFCAAIPSYHYLTKVQQPGWTVFSCGG